MAPPGFHVFVTAQEIQLYGNDDPLTFGWGDTVANKTTQIGARLTGGDHKPLVAMASRNANMWIYFEADYIGENSGFSFHVESRRNGKTPPIRGHH